MITLAENQKNVKVGIIIPSYNVEENLGDILATTQSYILPKYIWVINDGSIDETRAIAKRIGVNLVEHPLNLGKGAALQSGFQAVLKSDCEYLITMDGDGQHDPHCIPEFIRTQQRNACDIVLGKREFNPSVMPVDRILSNRLSSLLVSWACGARIPDSQCGFRLFKTDLFKNMSLKTTHYDTETEILLNVLKKHHTRIAFCSVPTLYNAKLSHINRIIDSIRFCKLLFRHLFKRL